MSDAFLHNGASKLDSRTDPSWESTPMWPVAAPAESVIDDGPNSSSGTPSYHLPFPQHQHRHLQEQPQQYLHRPGPSDGGIYSRQHLQYPHPHQQQPQLNHSGRLDPLVSRTAEYNPYARTNPRPPLRLYSDGPRYPHHPAFPLYAPAPPSKPRTNGFPHPSDGLHLHHSKTVESAARSILDNLDILHQTASMVLAQLGGHPSSLRSDHCLPSSAHLRAAVQAAHTVLDAAVILDSSQQLPHFAPPPPLVRPHVIQDQPLHEIPVPTTQADRTRQSSSGSSSASNAPSALGLASPAPRTVIVNDLPDLELIRSKRPVSSSGASARPVPRRPLKSVRAKTHQCHSCHVTETPEWRRGPDGRATLCNACGLHWAKIQRQRGDHNNNNNNAGAPSDPPQ
ncbi:hypothetical protein BC828DRAFT_414593 [Blastocladiella britannica]|nr:hypothetical protein BC828DRAFT_414593 [Blastocladiella britannica]